MVLCLEKVVYNRCTVYLEHADGKIRGKTERAALYVHGLEKDLSRPTKKKFVIRKWKTLVTEKYVSVVAHVFSDCRKTM